MSLLNLTGRTYGKLRVIAERDYRWICQCECGVQMRVSALALRRGTVKDCGCTLRAVAGKFRPRCIVPKCYGAQHRLKLCLEHYHKRRDAHRRRVPDCLPRVTPDAPRVGARCACGGEVYAKGLCDPCFDRQLLREMRAESKAVDVWANTGRTWGDL